MQESIQLQNQKKAMSKIKTKFILDSDKKKNKTDRNDLLKRLSDIEKWFENRLKEKKKESRDKTPNLMRHVKRLKKNNKRLKKALKLIERISKNQRTKT